MNECKKAYIAYCKEVHGIWETMSKWSIKHGSPDWLMFRFAWKAGIKASKK